MSLDTALIRVLLGYRIVGALWLCLLAAISVASGAVGLGGVLPAVACAVGWSAATVTVGTRHPARLAGWDWFSADLAVAVLTMAAPALHGTSAGIHGGYPFASVLLGAGLHGTAGGLVAAGVLALATVTLEGAAAAVGATLIYLVGALIVPWGLRELRAAERAQRTLEARLADERSARARSEERAETAAALHDSVLQTLALIQRASQDPGQGAALARRQERQLRQWLSGERPSLVDGEGSFTRALRVALAEVEQHYRLEVEVVAVGDATTDERSRALLSAATEAVTNAGRHAGVDRVAVYIEIEAQHMRVFVRDRGAGFVLADVLGDRRGIRESIVGRMERAGGAAIIRAAPGEGTEVELRLPRAAAAGADAAR